MNNNPQWQPQFEQSENMFSLRIISLMFVLLQLLFIVIFLPINLPPDLVRWLHTSALSSFFVARPYFTLVVISVIVTITGGTDIYLTSRKAPVSAILALITIGTILVSIYSAGALDSIYILATLFTFVFFFFWIIEIAYAFRNFFPAKSNITAIDPIGKEESNFVANNDLLKQKKIALARIGIALAMVGDIIGTIVVFNMPQ